MWASASWFRLVLRGAPSAFSRALDRNYHMSTGLSTLVTSFPALTLILFIVTGIALSERCENDQRISVTAYTWNCYVEKSNFAVAKLSFRHVTSLMR